MLREYSSSSERISAPCHLISPLSGVVSPQMIRSKLVLPQPLGPVTCSNVPGVKEKLTSRKSLRSPRRHSKLATSSMALCPPAGAQFVRDHCIELLREKHAPRKKGERG